MMLGKGKGGKGRSATRAAATAEDVSSVQVSLDAGSTTGSGAGSGGAGGAGTGRAAPVSGRSSEAESVALDPHLARDPDAFECPFSACDYDCQKRAPVRVPCTCKRLVCRKCADGALTHYCDKCKLLVCMRCGMDDHMRLRHPVEHVEAAAAAAAARTKASLDAAAAAHTRLSTSTAQLRDAIIELQSNLASAEAAVDTNYSRVLAQLNEHTACQDIANDHEQRTIGLQKTGWLLYCYYFRSFSRRFYDGKGFILI